MGAKLSLDKYRNLSVLLPRKATADLQIMIRFYICEKPERKGF